MVAISKFILTVSFTVFLFFNASAQATCGNGTLQPECAPIIPSDAIILDSDTTVSFGGGPRCYWVCPGVTVIANGVANDQFFLENGAVISLLGGENYVWMKDNSECTVETGSNTNWINKKSNTTVTDNGINTSVTTCTSLAYDYTDAPMGCSVISSSFTEPTREVLSIYPNPVAVNSFVSINMDHNFSYDLIISNLIGKKIAAYHQLSGDNYQLAVEQLNKGVFLLNFYGHQNGRHIGTYKLIVK